DGPQLRIELGHLGVVGGVPGQRRVQLPFTLLEPGDLPLQPGQILAGQPDPGGIARADRSGTAPAAPAGAVGTAPASARGAAGARTGGPAPGGGTTCRR